MSAAAWKDTQRFATVVHKGERNGKRAHAKKARKESPEQVSSPARTQKDSMNAKRIAKSRREVAKFIREHPDAKVVGGTLRDKPPEQAIKAMKKQK